MTAPKASFKNHGLAALNIRPHKICCRTYKTLQALHSLHPAAHGGQSGSRDGTSAPDPDPSYPHKPHMPEAVPLLPPISSHRYRTCQKIPAILFPCRAELLCSAPRIF